MRLRRLEFGEFKEVMKWSFSLSNSVSLVSIDRLNSVIIINHGSESIKCESKSYIHNDCNYQKSYLLLKYTCYTICTLYPLD